MKRDRPASNAQGHAGRVRVTVMWAMEETRPETERPRRTKQTEKLPCRERPRSLSRLRRKAESQTAHRRAKDPRRLFS